MSTPPRRQFGDPLTDREIDVLRWTAAGLGNNGVARRMHLHVDTVKSHLKRIFVKLGAQDRAHAVARGYELGYLQVRDGGRVA